MSTHKELGDSWKKWAGVKLDEHVEPEEEELEPIEVTETLIRSRLEQLKPSVLEIEQEFIDDEKNEDLCGMKYTLDIVSECFRGQNTDKHKFQCQMAVNALIVDLLPFVHGFEVRTFTASQWENELAERQWKREQEEKEAEEKLLQEQQEAVEDFRKAVDKVVRPKKKRDQPQEAIDALVREEAEEKEAGPCCSKSLM